MIIFGGIMIAIASALYTTLDRSTSLAQIIGFQIIAGIGFGCILNIMVVLIQADYLQDQHLIPHVTNVFNVSRLILALLKPVLGFRRTNRRHVDGNQHL